MRTLLSVTLGLVFGMTRALRSALSEVALRTALSFFLKKLAAYFDEFPDAETKEKFAETIYDGIVAGQRDRHQRITQLLAEAERQIRPEDTRALSVILLFEKVVKKHASPAN